jgi:hypothetical protein
MDGYTTIVPDEINGWSVIASAIVTHDYRVILAENYRDGVLVFVVSTAPHQGEGEGWHSGHYFDSSDSRTNREASRAEFVRRLSGAWGI